MNPDSFEELSCQVRLIWLAETADAERFDGAVGGAGLAAWREAVENRSKMPSNSRIQIGTERSARGRRERFVASLGAMVIDLLLRWFINLGAVLPEARGCRLRKRPNTSTSPRREIARVPGALLGRRRSTKCLSVMSSVSAFD